MVSVEGIVLNKVHNKNYPISFGGHNLISDDNGEKVYSFFIPKVYFDKAEVILKKFDLDENGNIETDNDNPEISIPIEKGKSVVTVNPKDFDLDKNEVLGYRFIIDKKDYNDKHRFVHTDDGTKYNIADLLSTEVMQLPKTIYHIVPTSFNPKLKKSEIVNANEETLFSDETTARINHFMKFDTSLQDVIDKIPHIKEMGFRRILSTPIFGQDNISSHGYWTNNPFQITSSLGTMEDFKKLQIELFKNSMGYIADGAFTNEGLTSIHLKDILRHGKRSPFINWFEFFNYPSNNLKLGILPDTQKSYSNLGIRVVNSPVLWSVDKTGKPTSDFGKRNQFYSPDKETYVQIYDKRLTSIDQLKKDEVFVNYDIKNTPNPDDITDWTDSVRPYAFPVDAQEVIKKAKLVKSDEHFLPQDLLMKWKNFELASPKDASGVLLWAGNKDIPKLRFVFPELKKQMIYDNAQNPQDAKNEIQKINEATEQVQNYIVNVGKFWTNKTAKTLREYIINELSDASSPEEFQNIIRQKSGSSLPESVKYITLTQIQNAINDNYAATRTLQIPYSIREALDEYSPEAVEVNDDITSVFSYPQFKKNFADRFMPAAEKITTTLLNTLDGKNLSYGKFFENSIPTRNGMETLQLVSDDIMRFLILKSLNPSLSVDDTHNFSQVTLDKLHDISVFKLGINAENPDYTADLLVSLMKRNLSKISQEDIDNFSNYLADKLKNVSPKNIKVANLIIDKTEAGLNWRIDAAKDIADIESLIEGEATAGETWGAIADFWKKFNSGVRLYNNHSYKIGEFTDTDITYSETKPKIKSAGDIEQKLVEQGGFTTQTNYSYLFDILQRWYGAMPEYNYDIDNKNARELLENKFLHGWEGVPGYLFSGNKKNVAFSHVAVGNHDKQRITHTFSLNSLLVYRNYWDEYGHVTWNDSTSEEVKNDLLGSHLEKASFFHAIQKGDFADVFHQISQKNLAKMAAFTDAMGTVLEKTGVENKDAVLDGFTNALEQLALNYKPMSNFFFYKNFEATYEDILKKVKEMKPQVADIIKELEPKVHEALTLPARQRGKDLAKLMVALPGNPTLYAGDELLEMGGEEKAKNFSFQNRNRLHWEKLEDEKYAHVREYKDTLSKIFNLRNDENLTSLVTGDTVLLPNQASAFYRDVVGMYRYNEHDDAIILMHNIGYNGYRHFSHGEPVEIEKISLMAGSADADFGITTPQSVPEGTKFVNALDASQVFMAKNDGCLYPLNADKYIMKDSVVILKRLTA